MTRPNDTTYSMTVKLDGETFVFEPAQDSLHGRGWRHPTIGHVVDVVEMFAKCLEQANNNNDMETS